MEKVDQIWDVTKFYIPYVITIISILIAYINYKKSHHKKLSYSFITQSKLIGEVSDIIKEKIKILVSNIEVDNIFYIELKINNTGFKSIIVSDFDQEISLLINDEANIVNVIISKCQPNYLDVRYELKQNRILIYPLMLNPNDSFNIGIFVSNYKKLETQCRIVGIKNLTRDNNDVKFNLYETFFFIILILCSIHMLSNIIESVEGNDEKGYYFRSSVILLNFIGLGIVNKIISNRLYILNH